MVLLNVYYSLTTDSDSDWTLLRAFLDTEFNDTEPTILTINLSGSEISRKRHYRLKFEVPVGVELQICEIERRFRVIGRSR